jgi:hypothetical protein
LFLFRRFEASWLYLFNLQKVQFNRRRPAENRHHHLQRVLVEIHVIDDAVEAGERALVDPDLLDQILLNFFQWVLRKFGAA